MDFSKLKIDDIEIIDIDGYKGTNHLLIKPKGKEKHVLLCVKSRVWMINSWYIGMRESSSVVEIKEKKPLDIIVRFWMNEHKEISDPTVEFDLVFKQYKDHEIDRGFYYFLHQHQRYIEHLYLSLNGDVTEQRRNEIEEILEDHETQCGAFKKRLFDSVVHYLEQEKMITIIPITQDDKLENKYDIFRTRREEL